MESLESIHDFGVSIPRTRNCLPDEVGKVGTRCAIRLSVGVSFAEVQDLVFDLKRAVHAAPLLLKMGNQGLPDNDRY